MPSKAPEAGWARLSAGIIHDPDWLELDAAGRLVFMTSIALAKAANRDGEVSLRAMTGIMVGALTPKQVKRAAGDLVRLGLWGEASHPDLYVVTGYLRWNESAADREAGRARKVTGAHRTNHRLGRHDDKPEDGCPDCERDATATLERDATANAAAVASERSDKTRRRQDADADPSSSSHGPAARPPGPGDDEDDLTTELLRTVGLAWPRPTDGEVATVARLLSRGWTPDQLRGMALRASQADVDPRAYLAKLLGEALNARPAASPPTERRGLLDDQRQPCATCDGSGMVGGLGDDGRPEPVSPCPDCHVLGATA